MQSVEKSRVYWRIEAGILSSCCCFLLMFFLFLFCFLLLFFFSLFLLLLLLLRLENLVSGERAEGLDLTGNEAERKDGFALT